MADSAIVTASDALPATDGGGAPLPQVLLCKTCISALHGCSAEMTECAARPAAPTAPYISAGIYAPPAPWHTAPVYKPRGLPATDGSGAFFATSFALQNL
jgi:hypothetical protein